MLVLSRKIGQQVLIGKGMVQVKVLKIDHGNISLGFNAPGHIDIEREEVYIKKQAQEAALLTEGAYAS